STIAALYPSSLKDGLKMDERFVIIRLLEMDEEFERMVGMDKPVNAVLSPITSGILNLPDQTGITLFLGIFRKELTLLMLNQALHTSDVSSVLSHGQILVLVVFTVLYIPCVATISTLWKEGGWKIALYSMLLN